jgi:hypothetical protein
MPENWGKLPGDSDKRTPLPDFTDFTVPPPPKIPQDDVDKTIVGEVEMYLLSRDGGSFKDHTLEDAVKYVMTGVKSKLLMTFPKPDDAAIEAKIRARLEPRFKQ